MNSSVDHNFNFEAIIIIDEHQKKCQSHLSKILLALMLSPAYGDNHEGGRNQNLLAEEERDQQAPDAPN